MSLHPPLDRLILIGAAAPKFVFVFDHHRKLRGLIVCLPLIFRQATLGLFRAWHLPGSFGNSSSTVRRGQ